MQHLEAVDEVIDLAHEALHEDHLREADAHRSQLGRKRVHVVEVVQLHGGREVEQHMIEVGTLVGQLVQHRVRYQLDRQFNVTQ